MRLAGANGLVVPPFECAWMIGEEARFMEPGKACVAFEAMTENDITVVFKELAGSKHYRTDTGPCYTLILGSHCNRRLKIEVDGQTVVDVASVTLQPAQFEHYWINIYDGVLTVGKGDPGQGVIYQWIDSKPNRAVQFVGLSSWDKHVVYRNIQVLPPLRPERTQILHDGEGFGRYLESEELADLHFVVASEQRIVPAHKILFALCCSNFVDICDAHRGVVHMPLVKYHILHACLQYIYTGHTQVHANDLSDIRELANIFGLRELSARCDELSGGDSYEVWATSRGHKRGAELASRVSERPAMTTFLCQLPVDEDKLGTLLDSGDFSDVELFVEGHNQAIQAHRLILSAWSNPFAKMFTNGMRESKTEFVLIRDAGFNPLLAMITFMYKGHIEVDGVEDMGSILLPLLILADQFGLESLQQTCINYIMDSLNQDSACAVLQVVATMSLCQALSERCEEICAKHFDFCTAFPALEFQQLEASSVQKILQHPDLRVSSEEKVIDSVLSWGARSDEIKSWQDASTYLDSHGKEELFSDRLVDLGALLPNVRFPLMAPSVLEQLETSTVTLSIPELKELVEEALKYLRRGSHFVASTSDGLPAVDNVHGNLVTVPKSIMRFSPRPSTYTELQYICDGDCNGVCYHIGTSYGRHAWMNPVLTQKLVVLASSPATRFTNVKALVSRNYQGTSFAGPTLTDGRTSSWWKLDLGKDHQLMCNYYTVRQDGSANFMRCWSLQGSGDDENWTELCSHVSDQTICIAGQYASWPVLGATANLPFRYFRVILTRPTTSTVNPWNLSLCYLELYGYFR